MADDRFDFCRGCGAKLRPGAVQCHECGRPTGIVSNTAEPQVQQTYYRNQTVNLQIDMAFRSTMLMIGMYVAIFMTISVVSTFFAQTEVAYLKTFYGSNWSTVLSNYGLTSDAEYINLLITNGGITLISTLLALIALLLVWARRHCMIAVMACALGALALICTLLLAKTNSVSDIISCGLQVIIGLMVARMIYRLRDSFES